MTTIEIIVVIAAGLLGIYESLSRIIPTNKLWSIVHWILRVLVKLSDYANVKRK
jgi:hypothetical protein